MVDHSTQKKPPTFFGGVWVITETTALALLSIWLAYVSYAFYLSGHYVVSFLCGLTTSGAVAYTYHICAKNFLPGSDQPPSPQEPSTLAALTIIALSKLTENFTWNGLFWRVYLALCVFPWVWYYAFVAKAYLGAETDAQRGELFGRYMADALMPVVIDIKQIWSSTSDPVLHFLLGVVGVVLLFGYVLPTLLVGLGLSLVLIVVWVFIGLAYALYLLSQVSTGGLFLALAIAGGILFIIVKNSLGPILEFFATVSVMVTEHKMEAVMAQYDDDTLRALARLAVQYPDMPRPPANIIQHAAGGYFTELRQWVVAKAQTKTVAQKKLFMREFNDLLDELVRTENIQIKQAEIQGQKIRFPTEQKVKDLKLELKKKRLEKDIINAEAELEKLKTPPAKKEAAKPKESEFERRRRLRKQYEHEWEIERAEILKGRSEAELTPREQERLLQLENHYDDLIGGLYRK